jgi:hypothetical protein
MSIVEFIPLNQGNRIRLTCIDTITIGRTEAIGCIDNRVSRRHAQLSLKSDGTIWIRGIHTNPTFYKTNGKQTVRLTKDKEYQLFHNDQFGLLPDEYCFRVSILSDVVTNQFDRNLHQSTTIDTCTISKSIVVKHQDVSSMAILPDEMSHAMATTRSEIKNTSTLSTNDPTSNHR